MLVSTRAVDGEVCLLATTCVFSVCWITHLEYRPNAAGNEGFVLDDVRVL